MLGKGPQKERRVNSSLLFYMRKSGGEKSRGREGEDDLKEPTVRVPGRGVFVTAACKEKEEKGLRGKGANVPGAFWKKKKKPR